MGEATSDDVDQSEAAKLEAESTLEELLLQLRQAENALCSVLGRPCQHIERDSLGSSCIAISSIPSISIRALAQRPDVRQAEAEMNRMAADGWRVVAVSPNIAMSHGLVVTFERQK